MRNRFEELPRYLTPKQVADVLQISLASFYKRAYLSQLPVIRLGGSLRVDKLALEKHMEQNTRGLGKNAEKKTEEIMIKKKK